MHETTTFSDLTTEQVVYLLVWRWLKRRRKYIFGKKIPCISSLHLITNNGSILFYSSGVHSASLTSWIKMNRHLVCFEGRGNRFGSFHNYARSGLVAAIKLRHIYGHIRCASSSAHNSYWGCKQWYSLMHHPINIAITDQYNHVLFPNKRDRMR